MKHILYDSQESDESSMINDNYNNHNHNINNKRTLVGYEVWKMTKSFYHCLLNKTLLRV